jgi:septum formation protein
VRPADVDETPRAGEAPADYVLRLAREKAAVVSRSDGSVGSDGSVRSVRPSELVLAADTVVVVDGEILGKPRDEEDARRMLRRLSGREHEVLTGIVLVQGERAVSEVETSRVRFAPLSEDEIAWYAATGEPLDKAGAYAIQGLGALFVEAVLGNYSNVVGLPIPGVYRLFAALGIDLKALRER